MTEGPQTAEQSMCARTWGLRVRPVPLWLCWLAIVATALALFWSSTRSLIQAWGSDAGDDTYSHGYLVAAICCWFGWRRLDTLKWVAVRPSLIAAILLLLTSITWLIAVRAGIQTAHQALLPVIIILGLCAAFGTRMGAVSGFSVAYLVFAIPVWSVVNPVLQQATVIVTDLLLRATGVTAAVSGNLITLPVGVFEVAGGCSGLHYFIVALALAVLYGEVNDSSLANRTRLVMLAIVLALAANWLRVYSIVLAGYLTDMSHYLVRVDHSQFGWVVFGLSMVPFFLIGRRWAGLPQADKQLKAGVAVSFPLWGVGLALLILCVAPLINVLAPVRAATALGEALPSGVPGWGGPHPTQASSWQPRFVGAEVTQRADYVKAQGHVEVFTAVYAYQEQGRELIGHHNSMAGDRLEVRERNRIDNIANELVVADDAGRSLIWYFYEIGDMRTNRPVLAQLQYGASSIFTAPVSRMIAVRAACSAGSCDEARTDLGVYLASAYSAWPAATR